MQSLHITTSIYEITAIAILLLTALILIFIAGMKSGKSRARREWQAEIESIRKESVNASRSVIRGQVTEQIAPYLPGFPFDPSGCRFIGKPVDYIVFQELENPDRCEIVLVEVKTGKSALNRNERAVQDAVRAGRVSYYVYRFNRADTSV